MSIDIRPLRSQDQPQWAQLWRGYQEFYGVDLAGPATDRLWQRLLDASEPVEGLGAFDGHRLVGLAHTVTHRSTWMIQNTRYLQDLFVGPEARRRGIARALIEAVYAAADAAGDGQVYWLTHVSNEAGRRVYDQVARHCGFIAYERHVEAAPESPGAERQGT